MKKTYKTIRLSEERYQELQDHRRQIEQENNSRISFDDALDVLFTEYTDYKAGCAFLNERLAEASAAVGGK